MSEPQAWSVVVWTYVVEHVASLVTAFLSLLALFRIKELHIIINSRLTELLKSTGRQERAEGKAEGKAEMKAEAALRAQGKAEEKADERQRTDDKTGGQP